MSADRGVSAPDPRDPAYYHRGQYWPGERLQPLDRGPADEALLAANLRAVARLTGAGQGCAS